MSNNVWVCNGVYFEAGDRVKIVRFEETYAPNGMGEGIQWQNSWPEDYSNGLLTSWSMGYFIGYTYEINHIDETGVYFVEDEDHSNHFGYPLTSLDNLSTVQKETV